MTTHEDALRMLERLRPACRLLWWPWQFLIDMGHLRNLPSYALPVSILTLVLRLTRMVFLTAGIFPRGPPTGPSWTWMPIAFASVPN